MPSSYGPPGQVDLEQLARQFRRFRRIFAAVIIVIIVVGAIGSVVYSVPADSEGVVLRFGKYRTTVGPGLNFKLPWPADEVYKVPVLRPQTLEFGFATLEAGKVTRYAPASDDQRTVARMLTGDLNLAHIEWIIQYRVKDAKNYLFHVGGHQNVHIAVADLIRDVSEAVMRRLVGDHSVDEAITTGRDEIAAEAERLCQELLDEYQAGVEVIFVKLQSATPPEPVKDAFDNVNRARQEKERIINQARGERNRQVPAARGKRDRAIAEAEGYRERTVRAAQGQANAFVSKFTEYEKAPEITRMRLYLEAMEQIISQVKELVVIDEEVRGVLPLLNLDAPASSGKGGGLR